MDDSACARKKIFRSCLPGLLVLCLATAVHGAEPADLAAGIKAYRDARYQQAVSILKELDPRSLSSQEQVLLHKFLALSLFARNDRNGAEQEFMELLKVDAAYAIAEPDFSPEVVKIFKRARTVLGNQLSDAGLEKYRSKDNPAATALFRQALAIDPANQIAKDFLPLVEKPPEPEKPVCAPSLSWGSLDTRGGQCKPVDVSSALKLPRPANRITLVYAVHHSGLGKCWKIVLYDAKGEVIHTFDDPGQKFAAEKEPEQAARWQVLELPEVRTIAKVEMQSQQSPALKRILSPDVGKNLLDTLLLSFEVVCRDK